MDSDYKPSKKYTQDQLNNLDINYKFKDFCQDHYADYISCTRTHSIFLQNKLLHNLPLSEYYTTCKVFRKQWEKCQNYRQREVLKYLQQIFKSQKQQIS